MATISAQPRLDRVQRAARAAYASADSALRVRDMHKFQRKVKMAYSYDADGNRLRVSITKLLGLE